MAASSFPLFNRNSRRKADFVSERKIGSQNFLWWMYLRVIADL
jgi:hypothetical protein